MRSASAHIVRVLALACCLALLAGACAGCMTTQEKAALKQAQAKRILEARELRRERRLRQDHRSRSEKE